MTYILCILSALVGWLLVVMSRTIEKQNKEIIDNEAVIAQRKREIRNLRYDLYTGASKRDKYEELFKPGEAVPLKNVEQKRKRGRPRKEVK